MTEVIALVSPFLPWLQIPATGAVIGYAVLAKPRSGRILFQNKGTMTLLIFVGVALFSHYWMYAVREAGECVGGFKGDGTCENTPDRIATTTFWALSFLSWNYVFSPIAMVIGFLCECTARLRARDLRVDPWRRR
ncbi:MAG: hypothetical protein AAFV19_20570 [Pseudomonadota bacterium]